MIKEILPVQSIAEKAFYYPNIDGMRGIAVLMILLVHTSQSVGNVFHGSFSSLTLEDFTNAGARGVQLFFILSAFTLVNSHYARLQNEKNPNKNFYLRRFFRIWPFWAIMVIFMAYMTGTLFDLPLIFSNLFFLFGFVRYQPGAELVGGGGTIFVEVIFYLLLPLILLFVKDLRKACIFFIVTLFIAAGWWYIAWEILHLPFVNGFIDFFPLAWGFAFAIGIIFYYMISQELSTPSILKNPKYFLLLDILAFAAVILLIRTGPFIATFSFVFLFLASIPEKTVTGMITRNPIIMRFGICCYSIYLLQFPLMKVLDPVKNCLFMNIGLINAPIEIKLLIWFPVVALISLCLAYLTFSLIEKPCVEIGKRVILKFEKRGESN